MINHILNNIKSLLKKELLFVMMLVFIQLISVIVIFSSYGIINHYNTKTKEWGCLFPDSPLVFYFFPVFAAAFSALALALCSFLVNGLGVTLPRIYLISVM